VSSSERVRKSRFLSRALRHRPERIGIALDAAGWVSVDELCAACARHGVAIDRDELFAIVRESDKQRFALSEDGRRIRAQQGHSVEVDLGYEPLPPPELLFHGTVAKLLPAIFELGLLRGGRHHVHLSADRDTASRVGARRGKPVILTVQAGRMHADGFVFLRTGNAVWLTEHVPPAYLESAP
jgi:putative RNA 2'-phosphotransferase